MKGSFKLDSSKFQSAVAQLAALAKKKPIHTVMRQTAGQLIREVVSVTPPAQGEANIAAKKMGEKAIENDLAKLMVAAAPRAKDAETDPNGAQLRLKTDALNVVLTLLDIGQARLN